MSNKEMVGIFWDYENCPPACNSSGYEVVDSIRRMSYRFGDVTIFKAYLELTAQTSSKSLGLRSELQSSGVSLTDCPHNGRKDVADKMILVDMLAFAIDNQAPATIILISGDRDFAYAVSVLRLRRYCVVVVAPPMLHDSLKLQASIWIDWHCEILRKDDIHAVTSKKPGLFVNEINPSLLSTKCEEDQTSLPSSLSYVAPPSMIPNPSIPSQSSPLQPSFVVNSTMQTGGAVGQPSTTSPAGAHGSRGLTEGSISQQTPISSGNTLSVVEPQRTQKPLGVNHPNEHAIVSRDIAVSESGNGSDHVWVFGNHNTTSLSMIDPIAESLNTNANPHSSTSIKTHVPQKPLEFDDANLGQNEDRGKSLSVSPSSDSLYTTCASVRSCPGAIETPLSPSFSDFDDFENEMAHETSTLSSPTPPSAPAALRPTTMTLDTVLARTTAGNPLSDIGLNHIIEGTTSATEASFTSVPAEFQILVEELRRQKKKGCSRPLRSVVAVELQKRNSCVYKQAGVKKFKQYIALAVHAQIVNIGGSEAEAWISLHPALANISSLSTCRVTSASLSNSSDTLTPSTGTASFVMEPLMVDYTPPTVLNAAITPAGDRNAYDTQAEVSSTVLPYSPPSSDCSFNTAASTAAHSVAVDLSSQFSTTDTSGPTARSDACSAFLPQATAAFDANMISPGTTLDSFIPQMSSDVGNVDTENGSRITSGLYIALPSGSISTSNPLNGIYGDILTSQSVVAEYPITGSTPNPVSSALQTHPLNGSSRIQTSISTPKSTARVVTTSEPNARFRLLVEQLQRVHSTFKAPRLFCALLAQDLIIHDKLIYEKAKVKSFDEYIALAVNAGIVEIRGEGRQRWISLTSQS